MSLRISLILAVSILACEIGTGVESAQQALDRAPLLADSTARAPLAPRGALDGAWSVGLDGSANYVVPLQVPPGRGDVTPSLSLSYSSSRGFGHAGLGWSVDGFSEVRPCRLTLARDGKVWGVQFDADDSYCLDGERLVVQSTYPGGAGTVTEYRTLHDQDLRITSGPPDELGPSWFRVETPDGNVRKYATRVVARQTTRANADGDPEAERKVAAVWVLDEVVDAAGNYAEYSYDIRDHGESSTYAFGLFDDRTAVSYRPLAIRYSGHYGRSLQPRRTIKFVWVDAKEEGNVWDAFVSGVHFTGGDQVLAAVEFHGPTVGHRSEHVSWRYTLDYVSDQPSDVTGRSILSTLTFCDPTGCLPPTRFGWETPPSFDNLHQFPSDVQIDASGTRRRYPFDPPYLVPDGVDPDWNYADDSRALQYSLADFDGDGFVDLLYWYGIEQKCNCIEPTCQEQSRFGGIPGWVECIFDQDDSRAVGTWYLARGLGNGAFGDPKPTPLSGEAIVTANQDCSFDLGTFNCEPVGYLGPSGADEDLRPLVLDLNRDGLADLISGRGRVWHSSADGLVHVDDIGSTIDERWAGVPADARYLGDFDGDGLLELVTHEQRKVRQEDVTWVVRAVQPDGRFSEPSSIESFRPFRVAWDEDFDPFVRVTDWDGDGANDLLHPTRDDGSLRWFHINGEEGRDKTNFSNVLNSPRFYAEYRDRLIAQHRRSPQNVPGLLLDLNGDGLVDQVFVSAIVDPTEGAVSRGRLFGRLNTGRGLGPLYEVASDFPVPPLHQSLYASYGLLPPPLVSTGGTLVGDFNNDGRQDLLVVIETEKDPVPTDFTAWLYLSDGRYLNPADGGGPGRRASDGLPLYVHGSFWNYDRSNHVGYSFQTVDANDDGLLDIVYIDNRDSRFWTVSRTDPAKAGERVPDATRMVSSENGLGRRDRVRYEALTPRSAYYKPGTGCEHPQVCERSAGTAVVEVVADDLTTVARSVEHFYTDFRSDVETGAIGFGQRRTVDRATGGWSVSRFDVKTRVRGTYPLASQAIWTASVQPIGDGRSRVETTETKLQIVEAGGTFRVRTLESESRMRTQTGPVGTIPVIELAQSDRRSRVNFELFDERSRPTRVVTFVDRRGGTLAENRVGTEVSTVLYEDRAEPRGGRWQIGLVRESTSTSTSVATGEASTTALEYEYDTDGRVEAITRQPLNPAEYARVEMGYDDFGNLTSVTTRAHASDARPYVRTRSETFHYRDPESMFLTEAENGLGQYVQFAYEPTVGTAVMARDLMGVVSRHRVDALGRIRLFERDGSPTVTRDFGASGLSSQGMGLVERTAGTSEARVDLDRNGRPLRGRALTEEGWVTTLWQYDSLGRTRAVSRPYLDPASARFEEYEYDLLNRLTKEIHSDDSTRTFAYEFDRVTTTDEEGRQKTVVLDAAGRIARERQTAGTSTIEVSYVYGPFSRLRRVTDPEGHLTEFWYDHLGRITRTLDPTTGETTREYTAFDELWAEVDSDGSRSEFRHDILGRLTEIRSEDGVTTHTYDAFEGRSAPGLNLFSRSPDGTETRYRYTSRGLPESECVRVSGSNYCVNYSFDTRGRLSRLTYPNVGRNFAVEYTYSPTSSRLSRVADASSGAVIWQAQTRDAEGRVVLESRLGGLTQERLFDPDRNWLTALTVRSPSAEVHRLELDYDDSGLMTDRDWVARTFGRKEHVMYDGFGRIEHWNTSSQVGTTRVDRNNRFTISLGGSVRSRRMDRVGTQEWAEETFVPNPSRPYVIARTQRSERSVSGAVTNVGWDVTTDVGGRTTGGAWDSIDYTEFDLPRRVVDGGVATAFLYDAQGRRVRKTSPTRDIITIGPIYERHSQSGVVRYVARVYAESQVVAELNFDSAGRMTAEAVFSDHLGSPILKTDTAGAVTENRWYGPFGRELDATGRSITPNPADDRLGFTGHRQDPELAWIDMGGRIYDPMTSRFLTPDPIRETFDPFSYARNLPFNRIDPSGFNTKDPLYGPPPRTPVIDRIERQFLARYTADGMDGEHIQRQPPGNCDDAGCSNRKQDPGESRVTVDTGNTFVAFSADEEGIVQARPEVVAAYNPASWTRYRESQAFNEALSHSGANIATLGVPQTIETARVVIEDQLNSLASGQVPRNPIDYHVASAAATLQLAQVAASDEAGAERGAARGALAGMGMETVAFSIMGHGVRRAGRLRVTDGCFEAGTDVHTVDGVVAIEEVELGQFVLPTVDGCAADLPRVPVRGMYISTRDPNVVLELLQDEDEISLVGDISYLEAAELGVAGWFQLVETQRLSATERARLGCPVLGRIRRYASDVLELTVSDGVRFDTLVVTASHPLHSADRGTWVAAGELELGEQLVAGASNLRVVALATVEDRDVFNLWVAGSHRYLVGDLGVEAHNTCWTDRAIANGWRIQDWMEGHRPHGHHIIPKDLLKYQIVRDLHALAREFNFDLNKIWYDADNLTIAPNGLGIHSIPALTKVFQRLSAAQDEVQFRQILRQLGQEMNDGSFFRSFAHPSNRFRRR